MRQYEATTAVTKRRRRFATYREALEWGGTSGTITDVADGDALERIADMLRTPEWSVSMLEDIADICREAGCDLDRAPDNEYIPH